METKSLGYYSVMFFSLLNLDDVYGENIFRVAVSAKGKFVFGKASQSLLRT